MPALRDVSCSPLRPRRERVRRGWLALAVLLVLGFPGRASASPAPQVEVVDEGDPELARKLRAEVLYAGFVLAAPSQRASLGDGTGARGEAPLASIRVASDSRVELAVAHASPSSMWSAQTVVRRPSERDSFALRVVEQLRARLVDLGWQAPATSLPPAPPASLPAAAAPQAPAVAEAPRAASDTSRAATLWLVAGAGGSWATGGLGALPHGSLGVRVELGPTWGAGLTARLPLADRQVAASEGEAQASWQLWSAGMDYALPLSRAWAASAGMALGLLVVDVQAKASSGFTGHPDRLLAGVYHGELCAARRLSEGLRLRATLLAGIIAPRPLLRFDDREVASLGRFFGALGLSFEVGFPLGGWGGP